MEKHTLIIKKAIVVLLFLSTTAVGYSQHSLYEDPKAAQVGDILTIVLQENISGSTSSDAKNSSNSDASAGGSVSGNFIPFQPTFGSDAEVNYDADEAASTNQGQLLKGRMTVEVVELTPSGNLVIEGSRSTEINGERHQVDLTGVVRRTDIDGDNRVLSYHVSNAKINYEKEGGVKGLTKKEGFLKRAALTAVGVGLAAVAVFKAMN